MVFLDQLDLIWLSLVLTILWDSALSPTSPWLSCLPHSSRYAVTVPFRHGGPMESPLALNCVPLMPHRKQREIWENEKSQVLSAKRDMPSFCCALLVYLVIGTFSRVPDRSQSCLASYLTYLKFLLSLALPRRNPREVLEGPSWHFSCFCQICLITIKKLSSFGLRSRYSMLSLPTIYTLSSY